jgi:tetratricopeptide (TPR) repeat protein
VTQQDFVKLTDGYLAQVPLELHFGLGDAARIESVEVAWPSGETQRFFGLPAGRLLTLTEGSTEVGVEPLKRWPEESRPARRAAYALDAEVQRLEGGKNALAVKNRALVVNFWAPSCAPCKVELPELAALHARYSARADFAGVCVETKDLASVRETVRTLELAYPQFLADDALVRSFFGADARVVLPSTFVFDPSGRLRRVFRRAIRPAELETLLDAFLDDAVSATALQMHCESLMASRKFEEAEACLRRSIAAEPRRARAHYFLGECLMSLQRFDEAIVALKDSLALDPDYPTAHINLGISYQAKGREAEAIPEYEAALKLRGELPHVLLNLSAAALKLKRIPLAREAMARAVKADPESAAVHKSSGKLHAALGEAEEAREAFRRALELDPADAETREILSKLPSGPR